MQLYTGKNNHSLHRVLIDGFFFNEEKLEFLFVGFSTNSERIKLILHLNGRLEKLPYDLHLTFPLPLKDYIEINGNKLQEEINSRLESSQTVSGFLEKIVNYINHLHTQSVQLVYARRAQENAYNIGMWGAANNWQPPGGGGGCHVM